MIGICTDSNAQLPAELAAGLGIEVVPLTVIVDGREYVEGVDLDADEFYGFFANASPSVSTAAPSPGRFLDAYKRLAERGATEILSIHIGSAISATQNAAKVAASMTDVAVRIVDTEAASFVVGCAAWEAADAVAGGAGIDAAATIARAVAHNCGNVFIVGGLELAHAGGRLAPDVVGTGDATPPVPVLSMSDGQMRKLGDASSAQEAVAVMASAVLGGARRLRVGIAVADASSVPVADALEALLTGAPGVDEIVRYRVGPSVGAHTGPGTAGAVFYERTRPQPA